MPCACTYASFCGGWHVMVRGLTPWTSSCSAFVKLTQQEAAAPSGHPLPPQHTHTHIQVWENGRMLPCECPYANTLCNVPDLVTSVHGHYKINHFVIYMCLLKRMRAEHPDATGQLVSPFKKQSGMCVNALVRLTLAASLCE